MRKHISIIIMAFLLPLYLYASFGGNAGGSGQGHSDSGGWNEPMSGYRFTIVNDDFEAVPLSYGNSIDILFSEASSVFEKYRNAKVASGGNISLELQSGFNNEYLWSETILDMKMDAANTQVPPYPMEEIKSGGQIKAQGDLFFNWMMSKGYGEFSRVHLLVNARSQALGGAYYFQISGFDKWRTAQIKAGKNPEECNPVDYMKEMGYNLVVEPIVWFKPQDSLRKHKYENTVYGTVSNFVQWFSMPEHELYSRRYAGLVNKANGYENHGGLYSILVSRVGKICMVNHEDIHSKTPDGKKDKVLLQAANKGKLDINGKVNLMHEIKNHLEGKPKITPPYAYAMHFYWISKPPKDKPKENKPDITGKIVVSSEEFDVLKEMPVDENVKIDAYIDSPIVLNYEYNTVPFTNTYTIEYTQPYSDGTSSSWNETVSRSGYVYQISNLECFRLSHVNVWSKSLQDQDRLHLPIILDEKHLIEPLDEIDIARSSSYIKFFGSERPLNDTGTISITLPTIKVDKDGQIVGTPSIPSYDLNIYSRDDRIKIGNQTTAGLMP